MKKLIFGIIILVFSISAFSQGSQATIKSLQVQVSEKDKEIKALKDSISAIPDTFCITALDSTFCVPTRDAQDVVIPIVDYIKETGTNGWPSTGKGWLAWVLGLIPLIFAANKVTAINNIWKVLRPYLKTRLGLAVLSGGALSLLVTFLVSLISKGDFNFSMLMVIWPWASLGASFLHNVKSKEDVVQKG